MAELKMKKNGATVAGERRRADARAVCESTGKSCLSLKQLSDVDTGVLREGFRQLNGTSI